MKQFILGFLITGTLVSLFLLGSFTKESIGYKGVKVKIFTNDYYQEKRISNFIYKESKKGYKVEAISSMSNSNNYASNDIMIILTK